MLTSFIQNFFILILSLYTFYKLLNIFPQNKYVHFFLIFYSFTLVFITSSLFTHNQCINWLFIFISLFIVLKLITKTNLYVTYITAIFSFSLSFITFTLSGIITAFLLSFFLYKNYEIPWILIRLLGGSIHILLISYYLHIPRLKYGIKFIYQLPSKNIGSVICTSFFMFLIMYAQIHTYQETFILSFSAIIFTFSAILIYWWNYHITQTYRKFLRRNELDSLNLLLEERNQEILYLKSENDKLARIIHKDNKIIPALSMAIIDSYENETALDLSKLESDSSLYTKLKQLYDERTQTLEKYQQEILHLPQTTFDSVNAVLSYMQSEALNAGIPYQLVLFDKLDSTIPTEIEENDFTHILGDLLINAINACKGTSSASIQVYLGKMEGISTIKICNTGNIFNIETLKNLGLARHTTHADTGGSGIGLMDIWKIKEKYKATLLIDEIADASLSEIYTHVNLLFNHKNHYIIQSDRHKELSAYINRPDIMILSKE